MYRGGGKSYLPALAYALSLVLKGTAVEQPKAKVPKTKNQLKAERKKK